MAIAIQRCFHTKGYDEANLGNVGGDGGVQVQLPGQRAVRHSSRGRARRGVSAAIPAHILIGFVRAAHPDVGVGNISKEHVVQSLVVIVVTIQTDAGIQWLDGGKVYHPLQSVTVH